METPASGLSPGDTVADRYEVLAELGRGGMGEVYRVLDTEIGEEVALKLLRPEITFDVQFIERFRNELKFTRRISHPNVCRVYHLGEYEGAYYITMEFVPGEDLASLIGRCGPLDSEQVLSIARQICQGLTEAHRLEVIHRDLKPQNVLLDPHGRVVVMDFGIARHLGSAGVTETGMIVGTPDYMSPEQVDGTGVDARSDIYSLGVIMFEMTTGRPPFEGPTPLAVAVQHQTTPPPDPRALNARIPEGLGRVILKCLEKDRRERYQSTTELLDGLDKAPHALGLSLDEAAPPKDGGRIPFVGRDGELAKLNALLEKTMEGHGQVAFVIGEAGSGKTALIDAFARSAEATHADLLMVSGKCDAHTGVGDPYMPFREVLGLLVGDTEAAYAAGVLTNEGARRLRDGVPCTARAVLEAGSDLVGTLIGGTALLTRAEANTPPGTRWVEELGELVERKRAVPADSTLQQSSILEQTTMVLQAVARARPVLVIVDDLQWADSGSIGMLFHLGRRIAGSRILFLGAFRPTEVALGREGQRHPLEPVVNEFRRDFGDPMIGLDRVADRHLFDALLDSEENRFGDSLREALFRHTEGHPLFTIELIRSLRERGWLVRDEHGVWVEVATIDLETMPSRVDAVIEERIARLPDLLRDLLRVASVEGEEFTAEVAARVQHMEPAEVVRLLSGDLEKRHHLIRAKGVSRTNGTRLSRYVFQHILFQRHLYGQLDEVERSFLHDAVGGAIEELYGAQTGAVAVQLARHFREAGVAEKAVTYLQRAGEQAMRVSANDQAIAHFTQALAILDPLPQTPKRVETELALQLTMAVPLQWARGFASPELARACERARELCDQVQDPRQTFAALAQLALFYSTRPDYHLALTLVEQLTKLARALDEPSSAIVPDVMRTWPLLNLGCFAEVTENTERAMASYVPGRDGITAYVYGFEMGVLNLVFRAWAWWFRGRPDTARQDMDRALTLARQYGHPHTLAFTLMGACELYWFLRDSAAVDRYTEEVGPLAGEKGFVYWQAHATFYRAERMVREGQVADGIAQMREGIAGMRATGTDTCMTRLNCRMAEACEGAGAYDEATAAIVRAMEIMKQYDERYMEAEIYRHQGTLTLLTGGDAADAEAAFERAIETATRQQALSLELRAVMDLARLWKSRGKVTEARDRLTAVYDRFTEGFDTPDLVSAKTLVASL